MEMPDGLVAVWLIVLPSGYASAAFICFAHSLGNLFGGDSYSAKTIVIDTVNIFSMSIWNDDDISWIIRPPFG